jgi:alpha-tubulin suppressor-like RCC1 family protein
MKRLVVVAAVWAMGLAWVTASGIGPLGSAAAAGTTQGGFTSLAPFRLLDTRSGVGAPIAPVAPGGTVKLQVDGQGGVPASGVAAVVLNVTVAAPTSSGYVTVYGDGTTPPTASNLNYVAGQVVPNLVVAPVGANGQVDLFNGSPGTTGLIADICGYFLSGAPALPGAFGSLAPSRLLDTRIGLGAPTGAIAAGGTVALQVTGRGSVPASGVAAVVLNVTVAAPTSSGYVTVYRDGTTRPTASNLNYLAGQVVPNLVIAQVGAGGKVDLYNGSPGTTQLVADVAGYFLSGAPTVAGALGSIAPARLLDTRIGVGAPQAAVAAGGTVSLQVAHLSGVPASGVAAVVLNVTVTEPTSSGYLTVYRDGSIRPTASNLNYVKDQTVPNLVIARVGTGGKVALYNGSPGTVQLVADVSGYYLGEIIGAVKVSAGTQHSCVVTTAGGVKCWGRNLNGMLGDGTTAGSAVPVDVVGLGSGVVAVSAGESHSCAVTSAGAVKCWGTNLTGQLGNGTTTSSSVPVDVVGLGSGVVAVSAGGQHSCALTSVGAVRCWGSNGSGQLGDGNQSTFSTVPVGVVGLGSGAFEVSTGGSHSCAVTSAGAAMCWGYNDDGELGNGTITRSAVPVGVLGLGSGAIEVSAGESHSCARTSAGALRCWGDNEFGQLGNGTTASSTVPVGVTGLGFGVLAVSAGAWHSCAMTSTGAAMCWGDNPYGQLGNGTTLSSSVPVGVLGFAAGAVAVSAGGYHSCAVTSAAAVTCWGVNLNGELGNGATTNSPFPVYVLGLG